MTYPTLTKNFSLTVSNTPSINPFYPLGIHKESHSIIFSVISNKNSLTLVLFAPDKEESTYEVILDPVKNRIGEHWQIALDAHTFKEEGWKYSYKTEENKIVLDPYARFPATKSTWGEGLGQKPLKAHIVFSKQFDWQGVSKPSLHMKELIIYEMHLLGFTQSTSSNTKNEGTFEGAIKKLPYLKSLGINALELLPIFEFDEMKSFSPELKNYWGYSTLNFFSVMRRFSAKGEDPTGPLESFQEFVKEAHRLGIEVILDVVFNHTSEGGDQPECVHSFKGLHKEAYYLLDETGKHTNYSGCGNTINCNHPVTSDLIINALRYWVTEAQVDGFRFDLASILTRSEQGPPLDSPPLVERISKDPILSQVKLIAEAWDAGGLYQVGNFPSWGIWGEWNGIYRDSVRKFIKGTSNEIGGFAHALSGSKELYSHDRSPYHGVNFIISHDGYSLHDLVSYQMKHNLRNKEENRDGCNDNDSWNCGLEGETRNPRVNALRNRQQHNLHVALIMSIGTPLIHMGDEYQHTKKGNNNTWCQDNELNWFNWDQLDKKSGFFRFYKGLIHFRKGISILQREEFLTEKELHWYADNLRPPQWDQDDRFLSFQLFDHDKGEHLFIAFNTYHYRINFQLPPPEKTHFWKQVVNTSYPSPYDFLEKGDRPKINRLQYALPPYSALILQQT